MRVRLSARTRIADGGRLLVGGSPLTVQRLRRAVTEVDADTTLGRRWLATGLGSPVLDDVEPVPAADLTVVVPAHGRPDAVARCLAGLDPLAVVVVDDASDPPLAGATVTLGVNAGPAGARNAGLARVRTPYVALVDSDVQVAAADLLALTRHLADPHVALVAPRVRGRSTHARWWERYDAAHSALDLGPHPAPVRPGSEVSYLPSACLVARTAVLRDEAGGFDEELRVGEDVDLVWRLVAAGHGIRYDPDVVVTHDTRPTVGAWLRQSFGYGSSAAPLAARHGSAVAPAVLRPGLGLAAAAVLLHRRWSAPVGLVAWAVAHRRLADTLPAASAGRVAASALGSSVRQEASLAVRHLWPLAALAATTRTGRRVLLAAAVVDGAVALTDRRGLDPLTRLAGRRIDDLAYGAGVWWGCARAGSARALLPRLSPAQPRSRSAPA